MLRSAIWLAAALWLGTTAAFGAHENGRGARRAANPRPSVRATTAPPWLTHALGTTPHRLSEVLLTHDHQALTRKLAAHFDAKPWLVPRAQDYLCHATQRPPVGLDKALVQLVVQSLQPAVQPGRLSANRIARRDFLRITGGVASQLMRGGIPIRPDVIRVVTAIIDPTLRSPIARQAFAQLAQAWASPKIATKLGFAPQTFRTLDQAFAALPAPTETAAYRESGVERMLVEHGHAPMKIYRILAEEYQHRAANLDLSFLVPQDTSNTRHIFTPAGQRKIAKMSARSAAEFSVSITMNLKMGVNQGFDYFSQVVPRRVYEPDEIDVTTIARCRVGANARRLALDAKGADRQRFLKPAYARLPPSARSAEVARKVFGWSTSEVAAELARGKVRSVRTTARWAAAIANPKHAFALLKLARAEHRTSNDNIPIEMGPTMTFGLKGSGKTWFPIADACVPPFIVEVRKALIPPAVDLEQAVAAVVTTLTEDYPNARLGLLLDAKLARRIAAIELNQLAKTVNEHATHQVALLAGNKETTPRQRTAIRAWLARPHASVIPLD